MYAVDVTNEQCNRPTGLIEETKVYHSGKRHLYAHNTELNVFPNRIAIRMSPCYPGSVSDIEIFQRNKYWHENYSKYSKKHTKEIDYLEEKELCENHPSFVVFLCDKGYTGLSPTFRAVVLDKKPGNGCLTVDQSVQK